MTSFFEIARGEILGALVWMGGDYGIMNARDLFFVVFVDGDGGN